jgi:hypothetical protein
VGDIARECPRSYYTLAKNAASLGYKHDATELIARYLVGVGVATRDADETAEEVLLSHPDETRAIVGTVEHLADAVAETLADWDAPIPEEHEIRTHFTLEPDAWAQFCVRAGVTPES